ncbi:hypothetical protein WA026_012545 [Henosepilachna vigintioctopunctata]|uniref:Uncharacterized protein n=1 Tax=Henosepilachna vigintioctopunctata TaxID=420089 RepID=A0AAW1U6L4_9CUCU
MEEIRKTESIVYLDNEKQIFDSVEQGNMNKESLDSVGKNVHEQDDPESGEIYSDTEEIEDADTNDPDFVLDSKDDGEVLPVRKFSREKHPKEMKDFNTYMYSENSSKDWNLENDPITVQEALGRPGGEYWRKAMLEEIDSFNENKAWDLVEVLKDVPVVDCK